MFSLGLWLQLFPILLILLTGFMVTDGAAGNPPDFMLKVVWDYARLAGGQTAAFEVQLTSLNGFQGNVTLSIDCEGLVVRFNAATTGSPIVLLQPGETAVSQVAITVPYDAAEGIYCGPLTATSNGLVRSAQLHVEVPPFGVGTRLIHRLTEEGSIVDLLLTFPPRTCIQVGDWGSVTRISNDFSVQVTLRNEAPLEGTCPQMIRTIGTIYNLDHLPRDNYRFSLDICLPDNDKAICRNRQNLAFTTIDDSPPIWRPNSEIQVRTLTTTTVTLTWTYADDDFGVAKYRVYIGSKLVGTTAGNLICSTFGLCLSYKATDLMPGETYTFRIEACDLSGNCSLGPVKIIVMPGERISRLIGQQAMLALIGFVISTVAVGSVLWLVGRKSRMGGSGSKLLDGNVDSVPFGTRFDTRILAFYALFHPQSHLNQQNVEISPRSL